MGVESYGNDKTISPEAWCWKPTSLHENLLSCPCFSMCLFHFHLCTPASFSGVLASVLDSSMSPLWPLHHYQWGTQCTWICSSHLHRYSLFWGQAGLACTWIPSPHYHVVYQIFCQVFCCSKLRKASFSWNLGNSSCCPCLVGRSNGVSWQISEWCLVSLTSTST